MTTTPPTTGIASAPALASVPVTPQFAAQNLEHGPNGSRYVMAHQASGFTQAGEQVVHNADKGKNLGRLAVRVGLGAAAGAALLSVDPSWAAVPIATELTLAAGGVFTKAHGAPKVLLVTGGFVAAGAFGSLAWRAISKDV